MQENTCDEKETELRKINCDLGTLSRAGGSAIYSSGETVVISSVNGPSDVNQRKQSVDEATVEVSYRPKSGLPGIQDKITEIRLQKICEIAILTSQHPRTLISIVIQEMHDAGGLVACAINSLCCALINSGLPMQFLFAGVCCIINNDEEIIMDPDQKQLKESKAVFTVAMESNGNIISCDIRGIFNSEQFNEVIRRCQQASSRIFTFYREVVKKYSDRISL